MRYILDDLGYIDEISFLHEIECKNKTCTEYTGSIPEGYSSLAEWSENAVIQAYKITNGNLTLDTNKKAELEAKWKETECYKSVIGKAGKNLFNKNDITLGRSYADDGTHVQLSNAFIQESYTPVESSTNYIFSTASDLTNVTNGRTVIMEYDSSHNFIKRNIVTYSGTLTITTTSNTKYVRVCASTIGLDTYQLEKGNTRTTYEAYYEPILSATDSNNSLREIPYVVGKSSKNLFDKNDIITGYRLDSSGANYTENGYFISNYIKVKPSTTYACNWTISIMEAVALYDSNFNFISRATSGKTITTTETTGYVRISSTTAKVDTTMFEEGTTSTYYEEYYEPTISIRNSNNIFQEVQMPLISTRKISFNHDYVYETDLQYHCFKIGKMVVLNIHTIAFKQAINHGTHLMSNLPKATEFIVWYLHGGNDANGTSVRCSVNAYGDVSAHYGGTDRYGDSGSKQYSGTLIYETSE